MKIAFNPSTVAALTTPPNNKDITFDLRGRNIFARGVKFYGTDTNTWRDIKINNVSIGSHTLDLQNGSNTTLTNTNGIVTINSTWRPVVDNLTSDSTTSSLSAKQGKVLKALIDDKSNSDHNHDGRYLKLTGGTMASNALITFADSGSWGTSEPQGARGGLYWTGQSDYAKLYAEETVGDNLDLVIQFGDDNSNGLSIRNKANTQTSYISSSGVITTGTFKGNLDWSYITNKPATATRWPSWAEVTGKPSSFTPSTHTHGLSNSVFFLNMPSVNGNAKWKEVFGYPVNYNLLLSVRINNPAPEWCVGNFGSGILYGGSDTKGFMSSAYNEPFIMWAGGNGSSDDSVPKWYIGIKGTHKSIYNLATIASEANAAYNLRHSHANKSVLDGITSALVNSWNTAYNFVSNITGTDTDKVINKWEEIVNFLAGITEDNKLNTLLNSKLSVYELADKTNVGTIKNNGIYYSTTDASSGTLINSPFNTGFAFINMTSYDGGDDLRRSRLAFNAFGEIKVSDDRDQANTAETWYNVLTSKNSGINGSTIKLNGTSITVYSSGTADGRYVKKSGDTMSGVLTIDTTNFGALTIKRNDDANDASIQFRGKSSVYGYIGLNNSTKDKQFLRWSSDTSRIYTILDTSSTYISNGKGVINGTTITQVDNATNSTNSTNARKLVNWYSARPTSLNAQFGDGSLRIFYATSSTTEGKPAEESHILHLAWDNTGGFDAQLAVHIRSGKVSTRAQNGGTWQPWKTLAFITDIPTSLKNPYSFNVFGVVYDGSAAKTVTTSTFVSQLPEDTSIVTDGTMFITSWASNSGFADTNAVNVPYKRKAIHLWEYIKAKTDSLYATKGHNHDGRYLRLSGQDTMQGNLYLHSHGTSYIGKGLGDKSGADFTEANIVIRSWWGISFKSYDDIVRTYIDTRTGNIGTKGVLNAVGAVIQGRVYNGGDDEGIIINPAPNGYAGLILGTHNGERSVFYLKKGNPFWRYNNGSTNLDIYHPKKSGTIALTSDIPNKDSWNYDDRYLRLTGGWMSGDINFGGDNKIYWGRNTDSASISFKNDGDGDANSYMSFVTSDNGNEYFRWSHSSGSTNTEWMALRSDGLRVRGTKVSLEGHTHDDRYYTKAESNAKYITDITTSVNKLTFTRNGSNIIRDITVNVVHSQGHLTNIPNKDATTKASPGLLIYDSYEQTIGTNPYSSVLSINTGGTIQIAGNWGDDHARNLYWRSQSDGNVADYPWKSWRTILDSENYSSTLDSRYYTESEVNSLLDAKLNRQNLSYGNWNPRGWNLAADYHYNGGDLSISESGGKIHVSVDGYFWQNEGQYRVLDTSDVAGLKSNLTVHQYLSATDATWYPLVWGGNSHNNTSDSTGAVYKSYDKLSWQTSSQTLYATNIQTNNIKNLSIGGGIYWNPNVESASDGSDAASITLVRSGVAGGTTLVLSQMNDTNDTIQFKTNNAARLYHNSYPILTTQNTYVSNNKGYINGLEITQVNNADTLDGAHLSDIKNWSDRTASAYWKAGWYKVASAQTATNTEAFLTLDVNAANSNGHATLFIRKRADSKPYFICTHNNNLNLADFRLYYNGMSMVLYARVPNDWNGRVFRIISEGREGIYDHIWTLYRNMSSTDPNAISAEGENPYINPTYSGRVDWSNSSDKANYANSAGSVAWNNVTGKPSAFNPAAHTHTVFKNNLMIKGTNGISDSASIHLGIGDSDTGFKWISDGVCQIYAHNAAVGQWTSGGMNWFKNPTVNGNKVWNAGNDGSGSGLDADTVDGEHASNFSYTHQSSFDFSKSKSGRIVTFDQSGTDYGWINGFASTHNNYLTSVIFNAHRTSNWYVGYIEANTSTGVTKGLTAVKQLAFLDSKVADSDKLDGYHANGLLTALSNSNNGISITVGGTTKSVSNISVNYAASAGNANTLDGYPANGNNVAPYGHIPTIGIDGVMEVGKYIDFHNDNNGKHDFSTRLQSTGNYGNEVNLPSASGTLVLTSQVNSFDVNTAQYLRSLGNKNCQTGRTQAYGDVYTYNTITGNTGSPTTYSSVIGFGRGTGGTVEIAGGWCNTNLYWRSLKDCCEDWFPWRTVLDSSNYTEFINNYYWANVKISASSSTTTSPTVHTLTATRVCAGHNPGIDNSISCSNWFRSSGNTGWYNTTYQGGWYMSDTSWIRAHNGVGIYTSGQIYSSSSIRMSNISLEHTDEINNSANGGIYLNYRNSGIVSLCCGGGDVGIGTTVPSYKLDVNGEMRASGFHHDTVDSDNYMLLAGGGYKSFGGDYITPVFLGYLDLFNGDDGTISSSFPCLGYSVPFTYTRGGAYCRINIPDTSFQTFYIKAAIAAVHYSGAGMGDWVGNHRGEGAWWLHCDAVSSNAVQVKGFHLADGNNDSWWGGNPLYSGNGAAKIITVCIFGHVYFK